MRELDCEESCAPFFTEKMRLITKAHKTKAQIIKQIVQELDLGFKLKQEGKRQGTTFKSMM